LFKASVCCATFSAAIDAAVVILSKDADCGEKPIDYQIHLKKTKKRSMLWLPPLAT
jgi:hypothetical protein